MRYLEECMNLFESSLTKDTEGSLAVMYLNRDPKKLKQRLERNYGKKIKKIEYILTQMYNEPVKCHYTFTGPGTQWNTDLDFYLVHNRAARSTHQSGSRLLATVFVINPPIYRTRHSPVLSLRDEAMYLVGNDGQLYYLYKNESPGVLDWDNLFDIAIKELRVKLKEHWS